MKKRVLLIEDNKEISANIKEYLELEDLSVTQAFDGEVGIEKATRENYDIILLDLMLPLVDGTSIARRVQMTSQTPIIMITAREGLSDRLQGFELWAVDYLVKPFELSELLARIRVHIKNNSQVSRQLDDTVYIIHGVYIDLKKHIFRTWNDEKKLTQKEYLIMEYLLMHQDSVVTRSEIIESLWWENAIYESSGDNKLDVYISNIRAKLGKDIIKTIKWVGYIIGD